jgi:hypothetical protein
LLGLALWGSVSLLLGVTFFLLGASPVVILIMTGIGTFVGALAGAASVAQPNQPAGENLDDYLTF